MRDFRQLLFCVGMCSIPAHAIGRGDSVLEIPKKPNILFILCDDLGYGDLGCYGQQQILTPNLDRMAREGMRFTQAYAGSPVSAPSRATLMTGQHTGHVHVRGNKEHWVDAPLIKYGVNEDYAIVGQEPYDPAHIILPEILKNNGYNVGMFGKWAGGYEGSHSTPDKRGIDEFFGFMCQFQAHLYYPNFLNSYSAAQGDHSVGRVVLEENIQYPMFGENYRKRPQYSADIIHRKALEWIDRQVDGQPFCGFLTYTLPHAELVQPVDSIYTHYRLKFSGNEHSFDGQESARYNASQYARAEFAAMVSRLDAYIGEIFATLEAKGMVDNTLVIFTSDNGPHEEGGADPEFFGSSGPLRGLKRECHEGGIRVPFIAYWRGHIAAGQENHHLLTFYDVMPTFCELIGEHRFPLQYLNKELQGDCFDGISFLPTLIGDDHRQQQHDFLYWEFHETDQIAVRMGEWKLIVKKGISHLYNLEQDIHEEHDVAMLYPDITVRMGKIIEREHRHSHLFPITLPCTESEMYSSHLLQGEE